eukprot:g21561.t1
MLDHPICFAHSHALLSLTNDRIRDNKSKWCDFLLKHNIQVINCFPDTLQYSQHNNSELEFLKQLTLATEIVGTADAGESEIT